jgi:hypothetical protein
MKTTGQILADKNRAECNFLPEERRKELMIAAMKLIYAGNEIRHLRRIIEAWKNGGGFALVEAIEAALKDEK